MADIFREVDEDIRQARYEKLWKRYRWWLLGLVLALIGAVAAYVIIDERNESLRREEGLRFAAALSELEAGRPREAAGQFKALADDTDSGYLALARLRAAVADEPRQHVAEPLLRGQLGVLRDRRRQQRPCPHDHCFGISGRRIPAMCGLQCLAPYTSMFTASPWKCTGAPEACGPT